MVLRTPYPPPSRSAHCPTRLTFRLVHASKNGGSPWPARVERYAPTTLLRADSLHVPSVSQIHQGLTWIPGAAGTRFRGSVLEAWDQDPGQVPWSRDLQPGTQAEDLGSPVPGSRVEPSLTGLGRASLREVYGLFSGWRPEETRIGLWLALASAYWLAAVWAAVTR